MWKPGPCFFSLCVDPGSCLISHLWPTPRGKNSSVGAVNALSWEVLVLGGTLPTEQLQQGQARSHDCGWQPAGVTRWGLRATDLPSLAWLRP